jgi:hypothetical protein
MIIDDKYVNTNQDVANQESLTKFDSFFVNRYTDGFVTGYSFVFITRPSLFIFPYKPTNTDRLGKLAYDNMIKDQTFSQFIVNEAMNQNDRIIPEQLSFFEGVFSNSSYTRTNFLPLFTNRSRGFSTTDVTMEQQEAFATKQGYRLPLPTYKTASEASGTLSLPMYETPNLDVMKTLSLWVNYISNITDGTFHANPDMVKNGIIDYMSSIYYFVLEPDGKTLKYWAKYTGCWPNQIPYSQMSYRRGESTMVELEATFVYTSKEDMNVAILEDFNRVSLDLVSIEREFTDNSLGYIPVKNSPFLNINSIRSLSNYSANTRTPLIFYMPGNLEVSGNATQLTDKFELSFGIDTYSDTFVDNKFQEDYFFNTKEFFTSKVDKE